MKRLRAFTLLELMAVVTVITVAIGYATVNLHGLSDQARLRSVSTQIGACYRLAALTADRTGLPTKMRLTDGACTLLKPVKNERKWSWSKGAAFRLDNRIGIGSIKAIGERARSNKSYEESGIVVSPGALGMGYAIALSSRNGARGRLIIDGLTGVERLRFDEND